MVSSIVMLWKRFRGEAPGQPCPLGGRVLPLADHRRVIWGGTVEEPWPSSLSRGCPKCGEMVIDLSTAHELPPETPAYFANDRLRGQKHPRVRLAPHLIPERVVGRVRRKFRKAEIDG